MNDLIKNIKEITTDLKEIQKRNYTLNKLSASGDKSFYSKLINYNSIFDKPNDFLLGQSVYNKIPNFTINIAEGLFDMSISNVKTSVDSSKYPDFAETEDNSSLFNELIHREKNKFQSWTLASGTINKNRFLPKRYFNMESILKTIPESYNTVAEDFLKEKLNYVERIKQEIETRSLHTYSFSEIKADEDFNLKLDKTKSILKNLFTGNIVLNKIILATIIVYININENTPNDSGRLRTSRPTGFISGKKILMSALTQAVAEVQPYDDLMDEKIRKIVWDNKIVFKNPIRISTYEELYLIKKYDEEQIKKTFNSLFANKRTDKIQQNIIDDEHNDKIIKDINNNPNHQNNMIFFDFMINICFIYSKKTELNDILLLGEADVGLVGGNVIFKTDNLLFKKDSLIKYFNNLEQLSELNDTIEKNKKIISTINSNVKYVNYFLNIINYIDNVATERTIFNVGDFIKLVAIDYDSVKRINEGLANKIFSGIDKSHYLIVINSNPDCLNLITKL